MADRAESENPSSPTEATAGPARRVFISYASHDAAVAQKVCAALEGAGFPCWMAPRDVVPGMLYADGIVRAINESTILVLILSESAVASAHVGKELERASSKRHPIIALRTDSAPLPPAFEYFLSESQWIDVGTASTDAAIASLVGAVRQHLLPGATTTAPHTHGASAIKRPAATSRRTWVIAAAVIVLALAGAYFIANKVWLHGQSASAVRVGAGPSETVSDKSIAVLPFTDMSEKHDQEYFGDGMAEEILDLLAKVPGLTVIGRTSSFQFKGKNEDLRTIGTKLNAAYVLEGSVRNSGEQVRITAQLINTRTGAHEWSETYDRHIGDVLKLQDAIAAVVVREMQLTIAPDELSSQASVKNAEAYDLYLRGRHALDRIDSEGFDEAATLFQHALELDPTFADAAAELANTYMFKVAVGSLAPVAGFEQARRMATNALKLDPKNVRARVDMAWIHFMHDWDWAGAERELQQAAILAPHNVDVLSSEAELSADLGRLDDALRQVKTAVAQDPLNADLLQNLSNIQGLRGNSREAEATMRRALDIRPTYAYGHYNLGLIFLERGDRDGALSEMQQETIDDGKQQGLALVYYALGRKADADAALAALIKEQADKSALDIAQVFAFRGQSDEAMHWLDRAYAQKDPWLFHIKGDWLMKGLEADLRYKAFLRKMNFPE
jgi:TolB-like protein/Flp pilus assembly protein TadD